MRRVCLPGLLGLALLAGGASFGADQPTTTKTATTNADAHAQKTANGKHTANKPVAPEGTKATKNANRSHLPAHWARIGLSAEQRAQVKGVMEKYAGQIKELEAKVNELKTQRETELHSLLTEAQKKSVEEAKALAEKVHKERKAATDKALAESRARVDEVKAGFAARTKMIQANLAKMKADEEKEAKEAKEAKSHPHAKQTSKAASKEATKAQSKESAPAEKQPEKK